MKSYILAYCSLLAAVSARCIALPPDVSENNWAAHNVERALSVHLLSLDSSGRFHGEAKVSRAEACIVLGRLAKDLEENHWQAAPSSPPPDSVSKELSSGRWQTRPVTRYILASALVRMGDYVQNGVERAPAGTKDTNRSEALPPTAKVSISSNNPAYKSVVYLASRHELWPGSPLLKADNTPITGAQLSIALAQMASGLNNRLTSLDKDANGNTPDASFHKKKSGKRS